MTTVSEGLSVSDVFLVVLILYQRLRSAVDFVEDLVALFNINLNGY
jgi:hypothetical protein